MNWKDERYYKRKAIECLEAIGLGLAMDLFIIFMLVW